MHRAERERGLVQPELLEHGAIRAAEMQHAVDPEVRRRRARHQGIGKHQVAAQTQRVEKPVASRCPVSAPDTGSVSR